MPKKPNQKRPFVKLPELKNSPDSPQVVINATQVIIKGGRIDRLITTTPLEKK